MPLAGKRAANVLLLIAVGLAFADSSIVILAVPEIIEDFGVAVGWRHG